MAEKKVPSGRKSPAESRGKAAQPDDKADGPSQSDAAKPAVGARTPAKSAAAKPGAAKPASRKSAVASKTSGPATSKPASGAPASVAASRGEPASETGETSEPTTTTIPATGAKSITAAGPDQTSEGSAASDAAKANVTDMAKTAAKVPEPALAGTQANAATVSSAQDAAKNDTSSKGSASKGPGAKPAATPSHTAPAKTSQPPARKGGFFALLLGGVCAAAIGFGAAYYILPQMGIMPANSTAADDVAAKLVEQSDQIAALDARIDAIPGATDTSGIEAGQADMATKMSELAQQVSALTARLADIEAQPTGASGEGVTTGQLNELRRMIKTQGDEVARLTAEADQRDDAARTSAQQDLRRAALTRIRTALDTGTAFAPALGDLERAGMSTPDALQDVAEAGVPTEIILQQSFAPAARAALAAARRSGDEDASSGVWSFMSGQLGARSLERREGPGTDAVLSRAEDDLRQGDLNAALTEVDALPDPARAALSDWADSARTRMQAIAAYDALAAKMN